MLKLIGVDFSREKTHISETSYEFAKRFIHNGVELTPFPLTALYSAKNRPETVYSLVLEEQRKDWFPNLGALDAYLRWSEVRRISRGFRNKSRDNLFPTHQVMMALQGRISEDEAVRPVVEKFFPNILEPLDKVFYDEESGRNPYRSLLQSICLECFAESNEDDGSTSLGVIALDLVIWSTSLDIHPDAQTQLIASIPVLGVQGLIEEMYLRIQKSAWELDTVFKRDWKLGPKALAIPLSDEVFYLRNKDLRITASRKLGNMLLLNLEQLAAYPQMI
jgi:hypothetical protein